MVCLKCDNIDPMKTDAVKWANSGLAASGAPEPHHESVFGPPRIGGT
jgi:hypothetical protein